jgi:putative addiction module component (TIGR02574 family)
MPPLMTDLEAEILTLPAEERARLLAVLMESLEPPSAVRQAWMSEAERRQAQVAAGEVQMVPGNEVLARIRATLR